MSPSKRLKLIREKARRVIVMSQIPDKDGYEVSSDIRELYKVIFSKRPK